MGVPHQALGWMGDQAHVPQQSDIFAYVTNFLTGLAVASLYPAVMTCRLHEGKGRVGGSIPLEHLG